MSEKAKALLARIQETRENVAALKALFAELFGADMLPNDRQFQVWLNIYKDMDVIAEGLYAANDFVNKSEAPPEVEGEPEVAPKTLEDVVRYASGCMKWARKKADGEVPPHLADKMMKLGKVAKIVARPEEE